MARSTSIAHGYGPGLIAMPARRAHIAKLTRPRLHKAVARERLFALLDGKREHPVVWIVGPPGAGKTTLAASYLEAAGVPAIWYQIDPGDSDPATFFYYLKQAVEAVARRKTKPLPLLTPEYLRDLPGFARRFLRNAFLRLDDGVIFVFDNYHEVSKESSLHTAFKASFAEVPPGANIFITSREDPPAEFAELLVNQRMAVLAWDDLRLIAEETASLAASRDITDQAALRILHQQSGGWMAGATLMLDHLRHGEAPDVLCRAESMDTIFDYFAGLVFDNAPDEVQNVLMKTALLPWVSRALVESVTGIANSIRFLEELHRRHLFVDRRNGDETTYRYHALFRTFLRNKAASFLADGERRSLVASAAEQLRADGHVEEAFVLYVEAAEWSAAEKVIVESAPTLISQGRWQTLGQWIDRLPKVLIRSKPWLGYWSGLSITYVDPAAARPALERVYQGFVDSGDELGQLLCTTTIIDGIYFEHENFRKMDLWIERLVILIERGIRPPALEDELRVNSAVLVGATMRQPANSIAPTCLRRIESLLQEAIDANIKVATACMLHEYCAVAMDPNAEIMAIQVARPLLSSPYLSAHRAFFYLRTEGYTHYLYGRYTEAFQCFDAAAELERENGFPPVLPMAHYRGLCERRAGLLDEAEKTIRQIEASPNSIRDSIKAGLHSLKRDVAFSRGDIPRAIEIALISYRYHDNVGDFHGMVITGIVALNMAIAGNRFTVAEQIMPKLMDEVCSAAAENYLAAIILNQAWLAHRRGDSKSRDRLLSDALQRSRMEGARARLRWYANALAELLPIAVRCGIEAEAALSLAREFSVVPDPLDIAQWPWPVKVTTLGRFELLLDGEIPDYSRKVPRKVLSLLKAIIAHGASKVSEQRLLDTLWPDQDGDAAYQSLNATLHRLRKLLGHPKAVHQAGGEISLNSQLCWTDARAFEDRLDRAAGNNERMQDAIALYRGAFLAQEVDASWAAPMRERLRAKFVQAVARLGTSLEGSDHADSAIDTYLRGIEADNLVEPFYQGLMRCYDKLNRRTEAVSVYRRLRETLSITLGVEPSSASRRLFESLRLN